MIPEATAVAVSTGMVAVIVHYTTERGLLHWGSIWLLHTRAALVNAAWIARGIPRDWRTTYPQALKYVRETDAMDRSGVERARAEAQRFMDRADALLAEHEKREPNGWQVFATKLSGALRRASLDLTRSLAEMRKSS